MHPIYTCKVSGSVGFLELDKVNSGGTVGVEVA